MIYYINKKTDKIEIVSRAKMPSSPLVDMCSEIETVSEIDINIMVDGKPAGEITGAQLLKRISEPIAEIASLTAYLSSTDWYATRMAETGKAIPDEIITERQKARDRLSELKE